MPSKDKRELFDPAKMQEVVDRLRREGRLPSQREFLRAAEKIRAEYRQKSQKTPTKR
jgi:hypothetical protein